MTNSEEHQLADRLSSYADAVVAVCFVNALAFFVAVADQEVRCSIGHLKWLVAALSVALHCGYFGAIWFFRRGELRLRRVAASASSPLVETTRRRIFTARWITVFLVGTATILVAWLGISEVGCPA